jgi:hypothetical protein
MAYDAKPTGSVEQPTQGAIASAESRLRMAHPVHRTLAADPALETALAAQGAQDPAALLMETLAQAAVFDTAGSPPAASVDNSVRDLISRLL